MWRSSGPRRPLVIRQRKLRRAAGGGGQDAVLDAGEDDGLAAHREADAAPRGVGGVHDGALRQGLALDRPADLEPGHVHGVRIVVAHRVVGEGGHAADEHDVRLGQLLRRAVVPHATAGPRRPGGEDGHDQGGEEDGSAHEGTERARCGGMMVGLCPPPDGREYSCVDAQLQIRTMR